MEWPLRPGQRPATRRSLPCIQLDQWPPEEMLEELRAWSLRLPYVRPRESRMASPATCALSLPDEYALGPKCAFIDDHEFCHMHPGPAGSIHLALPREASRPLVDAGWAEPHPSAAAGILPDTLYMVYAPRDAAELEIVTGVVTIAYRFARGSIP